MEKLLSYLNQKKEEQEEVTDGACNWQCPCWKESQSGAPPILPILPAADLPPQDPPPCLPTSQPLRYSYITDSSLLQSTIKTQKPTFSFGFVAHHRWVTSSCYLSSLPLPGSRCVRGTKRNGKLPGSRYVRGTKRNGKLPGSRYVRGTKRNGRREYYLAVGK